MPIYEYFCPKCGIEFELMRGIQEFDEPAPCPQCKGQAQRLVSVFASKTGFYLKGPEKAAFRKLETKGKATRRKKK